MLLERSQKHDLRPATSTIEREMYTLRSGTRVEVVACKLERQLKQDGLPAVNHENKPGVATIFLPGWAMAADSKSARNLGGAFAAESKNPTYAISTRAEMKDNVAMVTDRDKLYEEAKAIVQFIKDKQIKEVTLTGHSQGGDKAIDVAAILQKDSNVTIKGLVLIDSVGLYEQTPGKLIQGFIQDAMVATPTTLVQNVIRNPQAAQRGMRASTDILFGIIQALARSGTSFLDELKDEIKTMAAVNPRLAELRMPIILMSGTQDPISDPHTIIPPETEKMPQAASGEKYIDSREQFLQQHVFTHSPYIRLIAPAKLGHHGLPLYRAQAVAKTALYLLERFHRHGHSKSA